MLVASLYNGTSISLLENWKRERLHELRQQKSFYCPTCQSKVILKLGTKKQWHFAHERESVMCSGYERESNFHLSGKKHLFHWLSDNGYPTKIESYIPEIKQRPDLLYENNLRNIAVEFQCSPIGIDLHLKRTTSYLNFEIYPLWIIGANRLDRLSRDVYSLTPFEWSSTFQPKQDLFPSLIYYCPNETQFILLSNIITLSNMKAAAAMKTIKPNEISSFHELLQHSNSLSNLKDQWLLIKKKWRYHCTPYPGQAQIYFNKYCLQHYQSSFLFPAEAGWPHENMNWIETSAHIWQSWMLYEYIWNKPLHTSITFTEIYARFKDLVKKKVFTVRRLPLVKGHYSFAIMSYLLVLVSFGVLENKGNGNFRKRKELEEVKHIDQALELDRKYAALSNYL